MKKLVIIFLALFLYGCGALVSEDNAIQTLNDAGYTQVKIHSSHWMFPNFFGCSEEDDTAFECSAINPNGKKVEITVCSNLAYKGSTIRH